MDLERISKQIEFIVEIDKIKHVFRKTLLMNGSRHENDAEHSWHLAVMAILLSEYSNANELDVLRVLKMVLVHDIVEIDAGDTFCYDEKGALDKREREERAADRIFNILPDDQAREVRALWEEFEECETAEAKFANSLDRFQPLLHNYRTCGRSWKKHGITKDKVLGRNRPIEKGSRQLWAYVEEMIESAVDKGYLPE
ncbi:MAG: HD domain-containing protein [Firmicutes bacterium]|nr:HD domain-containing protein [Bacillota bacterium]MDD3851097.1 HD domain-containing protein [Bacillota bacterium]